MASNENSKEEEVDQEKKCEKFAEICIPDDVRIKYFPKETAIFSYDILPLFEYTSYQNRIMEEVSFLKNPSYAEKWAKFKEGLPASVENLKPVIMDSKRVPIFANYRRQKVPPEYIASYIGPSSPQAIFQKTK